MIIQMVLCSATRGVDFAGSMCRKVISIYQAMVLTRQQMVSKLLRVCLSVCVLSAHKFLMTLRESAANVNAYL